jgi:hypothetical protein
VHGLSGRLLGVRQPCLHLGISKSLGNRLIYSSLGILRVFLSDLELGSGFTKLIGGIVSVTYCEYCTKI